MIRRPPRSTQSRSSAASDVYKRQSEMDTIILLCDYAEAINGKLYVMGGGWTICPPGPRHMAIAVRVMVAWSEANTKHTLTLFLQDEHGKTLELGDPPTKVM